METLTDKRLAKIKAKREQANAEPVKKTKKTSKNQPQTRITLRRCKKLWHTQ